MTRALTTSCLTRLPALQPAIYQADPVIVAIHQLKISARLKPDGSPVSEALRLIFEILSGGGRRVRCLSSFWPGHGMGYGGWGCSHAHGRRNREHD